VAPPTLRGHNVLSIDPDGLHPFALHRWLWRIYNPGFTTRSGTDTCNS